MVVKEDHTGMVRCTNYGCYKWYKPEELVGKQVLVLVNLAPRELKGILSNGMILMAEDASGKLRLLQPGEPTNNGAVVG